VTGAGTGSVLLLRWYWWRINAWSEVSAMIVAAVVSLTLHVGWPWNKDDPAQFAGLMLTTVAITTVGWVVTTMMTSPEPMETLVAVHRRLEPARTRWGAC